jgi:hypothetical protein
VFGEHIVGVTQKNQVVQKNSVKSMQRLLLFLLLIFIAPLSYGQTSVPYTWNNVTIKGGGLVSGMIFSKAEADLLYARTDVGGLYRWLPATRQWKPLNDFLDRTQSNYTGVLSVAPDPKNADKVYMAVGQYTASWAGYGAIMASSDRGDTWAIHPLSVKLGGNEDGRTAGERLQVDPNLTSKLYLGTSTDGLWVSTNSAASWTKVNSFPVANSPSGSGGIAFVQFVESSGSTGTATPVIYVGVLQNSSTSLYRSTNGGTTWATVPNQPSGMPHHMEVASDGMIYLAYSNAPGPNGVTAGSLWKYNPGSGIWTDITPLPMCSSGQNGFGSIAVDAANPQVLLTATLGCWWPRDMIYRSTNGGNTWTEINATATWNHSNAPYATASTPHWIGDIDIDPFDSNNAWFITGYGIYNTTNLGSAPVAWNFDNDGIEETVPLGLVSPPSGAPLISAIGDIDGFRHDNLSVSPPSGRHAPLYGTNVSIDFAEASPTYIVRTYNNGAGNYGAYSTNGGTSWTPFANSPGGTYAGGKIAVAANASRLVWSPEGSNTVYSTNNGGTWSAVSGLPSGGLTPVADRANANKFYVYDPTNGRVYVSTNGAVSFSAQGSVPVVESWETGEVELRAVFGQEGHLWLAGMNGLYRSVNSGTSFTQVASSLISKAYRVGFGKAAPAAGYPAVYLHGVVDGILGFYRSDDEGATWLRINNGQTNFGWINMLTGDPRVFGRVYLATGGRGIMYGEASAEGVPVELAGFRGEVVDAQQNMLRWTTFSEQQNKHFVVEKSSDGIGFQPLAIVLGGGTTKHTSYYTYLDVSVAEEVAYYRLKQVDEDGNYVYSAVIKVFSPRSDAFLLYPNPVEEVLTLASETPVEKLEVYLYDHTGREIRHQMFASGQSWQLDVRSLGAGCYFLKASASGQFWMQKFMKY